MILTALLRYVDLSDVHLVSPTGTPVGSVLGSLTAVKNADTTGEAAGRRLSDKYSPARMCASYEALLLV